VTDVVAILPVKTFSRAKRRLGDAVGGGERRALAAAMLGDVLAALEAVPAIAEVLVVTGEAGAVDAARRAHATVMADPDETGQSAAAARGIARALERGAERVLLVPGDCPALDPDEVSRLLARGGAPPHVVIVPDRHGSGTNAMLLAPPDAVAPAFGAGSLARHAARAHAAGAAVKVCELPSLGLDVDTPDDLAALRAALAAHPHAAPRTRGVLDRLVPAAAR
jgi:2-phospho-L-lactate/phosphoenolpyruvate guanylyltransferase